MTLPGTMLEFIATRDHRLMRRVHRWRPPRWFRLWMIYATRGGDGWLWYGLCAGVLAFGDPRRYAAVTAAGMSCAAGAVLFLTLKKLAGRRRPSALVPHCWERSSLPTSSLSPPGIPSRRLLLRSRSVGFTPCCWERSSFAPSVWPPRGLFWECIS